MCFRNLSLKKNYDIRERWSSHRMYGNEKAVGEGIRQSGIARSELFVSRIRLDAGSGVHVTDLRSPFWDR